LRNPLLDKGKLLSDARRVLVNISGGPSMSLVEVQTIMEELGRHTNDHTRIYFGMNVEQSMGRRLAVTILSAVGQPVEAMPEYHPMQHRQTASPAVPSKDLFGKSEPLIEEKKEPLPDSEPVIRVQTPPVIAASPLKEPAENSPRQEVLQFEPVNRGRFEKSEPTIIDGEDLDVPTYLRKKQRL